MFVSLVFEWHLWQSLLFMPPETFPTVRLWHHPKWPHSPPPLENLATTAEHSKPQPCFLASPLGPPFSLPFDLQPSRVDLYTGLPCRFGVCVCVLISLEYTCFTVCFFQVGRLRVCIYPPSCGFPSHLGHLRALSSCASTIGSRELSILYTVSIVYICQSQFIPPPPPLGVQYICSLLLCVFLFCK